MKLSHLGLDYVHHSKCRMNRFIYRFEVYWTAIKYHRWHDNLALNQAPQVKKKKHSTDKQLSVECFFDK